MKKFRFYQTENRRMNGVTVRQLFLSMCLMVFTFACFAQDVIVTRDSKKIEARVTEISVDMVKYRMFDNLDGPVYSLPKSNIVSIVFQNGLVETFDQATPTTTTPATNAQATTTPTTNAPTTTAARPQTTAVATSTQRSSAYTTAPRRLTTAETLSEMQFNYPRLYSQWRAGQRMKGVGWGLTGVGIGSMVLGIAIGVSGEENGDDDQSEAGAVITAAGICLTTAGITVLAIGAGKRRRAIRAFNNQYYSMEQVTPQFQLKVAPNSVGLAYVF